MKDKRKAILLSALVLPGLGQITLKRYKLGMAILVLVTWSIYRLMEIVTQQANAMVNKMMTQGGTLDLQAMTANAGGSSYDFYVWIIISCWVISLVDISLLKNTGAPK